MLRTKIICTLGPASEEEKTMKRMIQSGMKIARINLSHGSYEEHEGRISKLRKVEKELKANVALMLDTKGPEIRIGNFEKGKAKLRNGQDFILTTSSIKGNNEIVYVNYDKLHEELVKGDIVLISDGLIELKVKEIKGNKIYCKVINGGEIEDRQGLNVPGKSLELPAVTKKDVEDILFAVKIGADFIAASFIRRAADVLKVKEILENKGAESIKVIAKIENREGVEKIDEIVQVADGVMIARGDLGVEIPVEEVPLVQKQIIKKCNLIGIPVVTATQMLDSMIRNPRPTRAETTDVANAIYDGTDAIMLSGETAAGSYPIEAVKTMANIAQKTEQTIYNNMYNMPIIKKSAVVNTITDAISYATCTMAYKLQAKAIITSTKSGYSAKAVAKYRPKAPIIAVTSNDKVMKTLQIVRGVWPMKVKDTKSTDEMFHEAIKGALNSKMIKSGELAIITAGVPANMTGTTNLIRVHVVGDIILNGTGIGSKPVFGEVFIAKTPGESVLMPDGAILVIKSTDKSMVPTIKKASAVITEEGGITSHAAIAGLESKIPVIVGAAKATERLATGYEVTLDPLRGVVYQGKVDIR